MSRIKKYFTKLLLPPQVGEGWDEGTAPIVPSPSALSHVPVGEGISGIVLFLFCALICLNARAATYYLDSSVASSGNGLSWSTAWKNFSNITGLMPGDVVNISGGASGQTYNTGEFLSASGSSGNPVTYKVATDAGHNGVVTINSTGGNQFIWSNPSQGYSQWVTFDGNVNGQKNMVIQGWGTPVYADDSVGITIRYVVVKGTLRFGGNANTIELDHITLDLPSGDDHAVFGITCGANGNSYTLNKIHDSIFQMRYMRGNGWGDDGFQWTSCASIYNNQFIGVYDGSYPGNQHQDGIQSNGPYLAIYGNYFQNMQNYPIYGDSLGGTMAHFRIYNNVMYAPDGTTGNQGVSIGCDGVTCTQDDIIVANNTITQIANCIFVNQGTPGTLTNSFVVNNICYNAGNLLVGNATQSNNVTSTSGISFVNSTSDWHLTSGATAAINKGINPTYLTSVYTTDRDGHTRTAPWDIGAYEFGSGTTTSPCDVNKDNTTNIVDVQQCVNQSLGVAACTADINKDGICNVVDVQRVVNAALGGQCVTQ